VKTLETTPPGETHWSTRSMAKAAGVSHTMVGRIWRTFRLQPHRTESFKISPDPQLVDKIRDVVGLYVAPPTNAVVCSVDEKSQIQALQRAQPILPMDFGQPARRTHNYVRHGTLDLFAALNVATGEVIARCKPNIGRKTLWPFCARSTQASSLVWTSTSSSTICRHTAHHRSSGGCCAIPACIFISRPPTRRGSIWWSGSSDC